MLTHIEHGLAYVLDADEVVDRSRLVGPMNVEVLGVRAAGIFPDWFIAFFYTGLGVALALAGASYIARGVRGRAGVFHEAN